MRHIHQGGTEPAISGGTEPTGAGISDGGTAPDAIFRGGDTPAISDGGPQPNDG